MPTKKKTTKAASNATAAYKRLLARGLGGKLMLGALAGEMLGTFILAAAVLHTSGNIIIASVTVMVLVIVPSRLTGAHVNPAVTLAMLATRQIGWMRASGYVVAQALGAMLGLVVVSQFLQTMPVDALTGQAPVDPNTGQAYQAFSIAALKGEMWRPMFAELLGGLVFGFGIAAAVLNKKKNITAGFAIGGSLLIGLLLASQASAAVLNPAVALSLNAFTSWEAAAVYLVGPVLGVTAGAWLYKLAQRDVDMQ